MARRVKRKPAAKLPAAGRKISKLSDLVLDNRNANRGTDAGRELVRRSIAETGPGRSIFVDRRGRVVAGEKTLAAAIAAGLRIRVVDSTGDELVVHRRLDLDLDSPKGRRAALFDNETSRVGLEWDPEILRGFEREGLKLTDGIFDPETFAKILGEATAPTDFPTKGRTEITVKHECPRCHYRFD